MRVDEIILSEAMTDDEMDEHPHHGIYAEGYCHALALAIHEKTSLRMVALEAREGRRWAIIHVMAERDEDQGLYLDITGTRDLSDILDAANIDETETTIRLVEVDASDIKKMVRRGMVALTPEVMTQAREAADWVIHRHLD